MTQPESSNSDLVIWTFDFALTTFFEIESKLIEPLLPSQLSLMEVSPGIGLINVTAFNFPGGALGELPEFQELILSAIVPPDLSRGVPKFAIYVLNLTSTCQEHLDHSADYYKLPVFEKMTKANVDKNKIALDYGDESGKILTMQNCGNNMHFDSEDRYFQVFTSDGDDLTIANCTIKASLHEHQESGNVGKLHNHPFFLGIDMKDVEPVEYLQMVGEPGKLGKQHYYRPEKYN